MPECFIRKCASTQQVPTNTIAAMCLHGMREKGRCLGIVGNPKHESIAEFLVRTMTRGDR